MGKYSAPEWIGAMRPRGTIGSEFALEQSLIHGNHATIIEVGPELAAQGNMLYKIGLRQTMEQCASLDVNLNSSCLEIGDHEVFMRDESGSTRAARRRAHAQGFLLLP